MVTRDQIRLAKTTWKQARQSAVLAHECWVLLIQSRNALTESYRRARFPVTKETQEFEKLMEEHSERYKVALEHMDKMAKIHGDLLEQFEKASP